tara:strand:+ start:1683 stop:1823 length:141 start_codon:yes stop_codon:yes gene_type:complete
LLSSAAFQCDLRKVKQLLRISKTAGSGKALPFPEAGGLAKIKKIAD